MKKNRLSVCPSVCIGVKRTSYSFDCREGDTKKNKIVCLCVGLYKVKKTFFSKTRFLRSGRQKMGFESEIKQELRIKIRTLCVLQKVLKKRQIDLFRTSTQTV